MKKIFKFKFVYILVISFILFTKCEKESSLPTDGDGNKYDTVVIGSQVWLAENLKTTKYNNGVSIPLITDNNQWSSMSSAAFCWYNNDPSVKENYGGLYNWWAVNVSFLCPIGYHVPKKEEWETLINYLGGENIAGDKLKATGTQFWSSGNYANNETGFTAMPGGQRNPHDGTFDFMRSKGNWWSTSSWDNENYGYKLGMDYYHSNASLTVWFKKSGSSVRCIKDN